MGEHAGSAVENGYGPTTTSTIPPQVLARWAAMASERAYFSMLPSQADTSV